MKLIERFKNVRIVYYFILTLFILIFNDSNEVNALNYNLDEINNNDAISYSNININIKYNVFYNRVKYLTLLIHLMAIIIMLLKHMDIRILNYK